MDRLTVTYPSGVSQQFAPVTVAPPTPKPLGELWTLSLRVTPTPTQFLPWTLFPKPIDGTGGQSNYLNLNGRHLAFERAINSAAVMQSLIWDHGGSIYIVEPKEAAQGKKWFDCTSVRWPMLCLAGHNPDKTPVRNLVSVLEHYGNNWVRVEGIAYGAAIDPTVINHVNTPWLVHRVWCGAAGLNDLPHGVGYMTIFTPNGFDGTPADGSSLWLKAEALESRVD